MRYLLAALILVAGAQYANAWSASGHKIVGDIAFQQLSPDKQTKIVAILKHHPRYEEDFQSKMPADLKTAAEQNEWLFQQAAVWPDLARVFTGDDLKLYHHKPWHYIGLPHFLTEEDRAAMEGKTTENISLEAPAQEEEGMNIAQALQVAQRVVADKNTPDDKKAVMLCWVLHLVGDIHQPLHSSCMYSQTLFPNGDYVGNYIKTYGAKNLHATWDQMMGAKADFPAVHTRTHELIADEETAKLGAEAAKNLDYKTWLDESRELALTVAYDVEVTGHLRAHITEKEAPQLQLTERYLNDAHKVADRRVTQAGYRLGAILKQIADGQSSN